MCRTENSEIVDRYHLAPRMKSYKFYKEGLDRWYVDLPEWTGTKADLEMVMGADSMLDIIAQGETEVHLMISETEFENSNKLELINEDKDIGGGWYLMKKYNNFTFDLKMWLCDVTKFVFGKMPHRIYIS